MQKRLSVFSLFCVLCVSALLLCSCDKKKEEGEGAADKGEKSAATEVKKKEVVEDNVEKKSDTRDEKSGSVEKIVPDFPEGPAVEADPDGEKVELRLKLKKGQKVRLRTLNEQKIHQVIQGRAQDMDQTIGMGMTMDVKDVDKEKNMEILVSYHWIKFVQRGGPAVIEFDSDNPPKDLHPAVKMFAALKDKGFTMKVNPLGKVLNIKGAGEMLNKALEEAKLPPGPQTEAVKKNLKQQFSDEALKKSMGNLFAIYPEKAVGVGSKWKMKNEGSGAFTMTLYNTYVMTSLEGKKAAVKVESVVSTGEKGNTMDVGKMKMTYSMQGKQGGDISIDVETGLTEKATLKQNITGTMKMDMGPGKSMSWPITIKSTVKVFPEPKG